MPPRPFCDRARHVGRPYHGGAKINFCGAPGNFGPHFSALPRATKSSPGENTWAAQETRTFPFISRRPVQLCRRGLRPKLVQMGGYAPPASQGWCHELCNGKKFQRRHNSYARTAPMPRGPQHAHRTAALCALRASLLFYLSYNVKVQLPLLNLV